MKRYIQAMVIAWAGMACVERVWGTPIEVPIITGESSVSVQFCLGTSCSTDTSAVEGFTALKLDSIASPTILELHDFSYGLTETINLSLTGLVATGADIALDYAAPGIPQVPVMLDGAGSFSYFDVPADQAGVVSYTATGTTCFLLTLAGYPCVGSMDLAEQGTQAGDIMGTVTILPGRVVRLVVEPSVSGPLDPDNPAIGNLTITGDIVGQTVVPLPGDADLNGAHDGRDVQAFVNVLMNPDGQSWQARYASDMNDDDAFDASDAALFVECLLSGDCE